MRRIKPVLLVLACAVLAATVDAMAQDDRLPEVTEGSLVFRSPVTGRYEFMPLRRTGVDIDVRGLVAAATVSQTYTNDTDEPLEAVYVFPLSHQAAVYDLEIRIGDRVIRSVVQERAEAKRTYEAAKREGRRAALVEQERPNVFTASVAHVLPGDRIDVRIRYVEPLAWDGGRVRLVFPLVVGPRYVPGGALGTGSGTGWAADTDAVPDASRLTPPVRHPQARPAHEVAMRVRLDAGVALSEIVSPSHPIAVAEGEAGVKTVTLAAARALPNRDFVLELRREDAAQPRAALFLSPDEAGAETHFMLVAYPPSAQAADERPPLEMLFLMDRSGSMAGTSIEQAREALLQALDRLRPDDRFNVVAYDHGFHALGPAAVPAGPEELAAGRRFVRKLHPGGGTEMLPALEHLLAMPPSEGALRYVVVLTDGCLGNEDQIFTALERRLGSARLFVVGIGSAPNHHLAAKMARFGRGTFSHIADVSEVREQMGRLLDRIESPVLSDLTLSWQGVEARDVFPGRVPDLFLAQPLLLFGRFDGPPRGALVLEGTAASGAYREELALEAESRTFHPGITTLWARQRVDELMDGWRRAGSDEERLAVRRRIVADALRYRLVTRFTSLVAVEDVPVNSDASLRRVRIPSELPHGWNADAVFGTNPAGGTADLFLEALGAAWLLGGLLLLALRRSARAVRS
jgi:Ca-activated chloride channel family protein